MIEEAQHYRKMQLQFYSSIICATRLDAKVLRERGFEEAAAVIEERVGKLEDAWGLRFPDEPLPTNGMTKGQG